MVLTSKREFRNTGRGFNEESGTWGDDGSILAWAGRNSLPAKYRRGKTGALRKLGSVLAF